jgi:cytochrome c oxidase cbb3-type subunit 3
MRVMAGVLIPALWAVGLSGCNQGPAGSEPRAPESGLAGETPGSGSTGVQPGIAPQHVLGNVQNPYSDNASAIATGWQLFTGYNCAGCHSAYAGGGMGPNLRDSIWIYGSTDADLFSTIAEGRPNGMPAWGGRLPDDHIWKIIAYIRTLGSSAEPVRPPKPSYEPPAPPPKEHKG